MRNAIILHGLPGKDEYYSPEYPSGSNSHWLPWLQKHLLIHDIKADTPEVQNAFEPNYESFVREVERFDITQNTTLVGHSMGAGFWVRYLSEHPDISIGKLVLVAPWLNTHRERDITFFDFTIDPALFARVHELIIFASDNDSTNVQDSVTLLKNTYPDATIVDFHNYGHFTLKSMKTDAFPELLDYILR